MTPAIVQTSHPLRAVRAALFATVCVVLAGAGHAVASGSQMPMPALLFAGAGSAVLGWAVGGRRRGPLVIGAALLAAQAALHVLFGALQQHHTPPDPTGAHTGHAAHTDAAHHVTSTPHPALQTEGAHADHSSPTMLALHLLAALGCALWLWRGEAAFFQLLRVFHTRALPPLALDPTPVPLPDTAPAPPPTAPVLPSPRTVYLAHSRSGRGPPAARRVRTISVPH